MTATTLDYNKICMTATAYVCNNMTASAHDCNTINMTASAYG